MVPSKPKKDESRRSSILKLRKPRQPLQNVNFNSSSNESSPATSKIKRRVSFAEKKHVKEFCHSMEQGTVWDNTYEEHDSSLKASFATDQNTKVDFKKSALKVSSENDHTNIDVETSSIHINGPDLTNSKLCTSAVKVYEDDKDNNLNFTNPVQHIEMFSQEVPFEQIMLPNTSDSTSGIITICTDSDKNNCVSSNEYYPMMHTNEINSEWDKTCIQDVSMEFTTVIPESLIPVFCDMEGDKQDIVQKENVASHHDNTDCTMEITKVTSWKNKAETFVSTSKQQENTYERKDMTNSFTCTEKTKLLLKSMDITEAVSVPLCQERMYNENTAESLISNYNNESMEITIPISMDLTKSDTEVCRKVPVIVQNCEDAKCDAPNKNMMLPTNSQLAKNIVSKQLYNDNYSTSHLLPDNSMKPMSIVRSLVAGSDTNMNDRGNDTDFNTSMEMTTVLPTKIYEKNTMYSYDKNVIEEDNLRGSWKNTERADKTEFFNDVPTEMTRSISLYEKSIPHLNSEDTVTEKNLRKNQETTENSDETELFNDTPVTMQMTRPIKFSLLLENVHDKENLRIDEPMFKDNRNNFSHNMSMEMTEVVLSKDRDEVFDPIIHEKNKCERRNSNNSITFSERTKLLCKSMDFTKAISNPLLREKICNVENTAELREAVISYTAITPRTYLPEEDFAGSPLQINPIINNDETIEITAAIQSTMHHMENITLNGMENLGISKSNEFQHPTINNVTEFGKNEIRENVTIPRETLEMISLHNTSSNICVLTNNFNHSLSATLTNTSKKRPTHEDENTNTKKFRNDSLVESELSACNNARLSLKTDDKYVSNECLTENTTNSTRVSILPCESNGNNSLNKSDDCSFLRKNLENSLVELQSINPPSFIYMSSEEENSSSELLQEDKLHTSITIDAVSINNKNNSSERLEPANIEHDETKDSHRNIVTNTITDNRVTDCQAIERTMTDDYQIDELNRYVTDIEHLDGESVLSASNVSCRKMTVSGPDHVIKTNVAREDQVNEEEYTLEEIHNEVELQNIKQKEQCSEVGEKSYIDDLKETESTIKDQVDRSECCQENSGSKVNPQGVEQKEDCVEERLDTEQGVNGIEEEQPLVEQDPFSSLLQKLEAYAERKDCIWNVYYKNVDRRMIGFGFMSNSLLIVTFLSDSLNSEENLIKGVKIISRLADDVDVLIKIVHGLILEKVNVETFTHSYKTHEDVLPMLDFVSQDVKLAMNFMFNLKRLDNLNLMEITRDEISFVSRSKHMNIILKITINVKRFDKLTPSDINIHCLLGAIKETEIKNLIKNVRKDHKFLSRYMNDVRDYLDIMEEISTTLD